jgi:hypothetical protein
MYGFEMIRLLVAVNSETVLDRFSNTQGVFVADTFAIRYCVFSERSTKRVMPSFGAPVPLTKGVQSAGLAVGATRC